MVIVLSAITLFFILSILFIERKKPGEGLVWILILIILPIVGLILYYFFGSTVRFKIRKYLMKRKYKDEYQKLIESKDFSNQPFQGNTSYQHIVDFHQQYTEAAYSTNNQVQVFVKGKDKYDNLFNDLRRAKKNIHLLYFGIRNDSVGQELKEILIKKAQQGVEVRIIYDRIGCLLLPPSYIRALREAGVLIFPIRSFFGDINYRNHRKIVVIDGLIGYTGGMNFGEKYLDLHRKRKPWRDTHLRMEGNAVISLQYIFLKDWLMTNYKKKNWDHTNLADYFPSPQQKGSIKAQVIGSSPEETQRIKMGYLRMISAAKNKLFLQTPYVIPDDVVLKALQLAASSGVEVQLMIPQIPGSWLLNHVTNYYLSRLIDYGVRIFYFPGYIHAKTIIIDNYSSAIGTVNLDVRSLELNDEVYVYFDDQDFTQSYLIQYEKDLSISKEMNYNQFKARSLRRKFIESILSFFSPLI